MGVNYSNDWFCDGIRVKIWLKDLASTKKIKKYICFG